jgi:hypothetical protein
MNTFMLLKLYLSRKALSQLYRHLNVNGEIGMYFVTSSALFSVYDRLAENPRWMSYMAVSPVHTKSDEEQ